MSILSRQQETKNYLIWAGAAATLLAGYVDLVRGGTTLSAILLTVAYTVLLPLAIWRNGESNGERRTNGRSELLRPSYLVATIVGTVTFLLCVIPRGPYTG